MKKLLAAVFGLALMAAVGCGSDPNDETSEHTDKTTEALPKCNTDGVCPNEGEEHPYCGSACRNVSVFTDNPGEYVPPAPSLRMPMQTEGVWRTIIYIICPSPPAVYAHQTYYGATYCSDYP